MKNFLSIFLLCLLALPARANLIRVTITVTNLPAIGNTLVLNGSTRTWTNNTTASPSTLIATNSGIGPSTTNLYLHLGLNPFSPGHGLSRSSSNVISILGKDREAMVATAAGWATITYSTNVTTNQLSGPLDLPIAKHAPTNRVTWADYTMEVFDYTTASFKTGSVAMAKFTDLTSVQTIQKKHFTNGSLAGVRMTNSTFEATNSYCSNCIGYGFISTNGANYGNAFRSPGTGSNSEQFGNGAEATNTYAVAIGYSAKAYGASSVALGAGAQAFGDNGTAIGAASTANEGGFAVGQNSSAETNGIAMGQNSSAGVGAIAIGNNSSATAGQFVLGDSAQQVDVPGTLAAAITTNSLFKGTNRFSGSIGLTTTDLSSLAFPGPTHNVAVDRVAVYEISGASANFSIDGFTAPSAGFNQEILIINPSAYNMTLVHNAGDPTAGNRIISLTGADRATTGSGCARLWYSFVQSRWIIVGFEP